MSSFNQIISVSPFYLNKKLDPPSFPGLIPLLPSIILQHNIFNNIAHWKTQSEQIILLAILTLIRDKYIKIDVVKSQSQFLFKLIKRERSHFRVSIESNLPAQPQIPDTLTQNLFYSLDYQINKREGKQMDLRKAIEVICTINSQTDSGNSGEPFVNFVLAMYKDSEAILFKRKKILGIFNSDIILLNQKIADRLDKEYDTFQEALKQVQDSQTLTLIKMIENTVSKSI